MPEMLDMDFPPEDQVADPPCDICICLACCRGETSLFTLTIKCEIIADYFVDEQPRFARKIRLVQKSLNTIFPNALRGEE